MYQLLGFPTQNTKKTLYVLEELNTEYEYKYINLFEGDNKKESFLKFNPMGKVPTLVHAGDSLFESGAICRYIANVEKSQLYPENNLQRAKVDQWMDYFSCHLGRWLSTLYFEKIIKAKADLGEINEDSCAEALKFITQQFNYVDQNLKSNVYLTGEKLSIADLFAYAYIEQTTDIAYSLDDFPHVKLWSEKLSKRKSIINVNNKIKQQ